MGAQPDDTRQVVCQNAVLERASGSVCWRQGGTEVLAAVHGPKLAPQRKAKEDRAVVQVTLHPRSGLPGNEERMHETLMQSTIEACAVLSSLPQSKISVNLQVVSSDGCVLACASNAACAALIDAGIPLQHPFAAVGCAINADGSIKLNPTAADEEAASTMTAVVGRVGDLTTDTDTEPSAAQPLGLIGSHLQGKAAPLAVLAAVQLCCSAADDVTHVLRQSIQQTAQLALHAGS